MRSKKKSALKAAGWAVGNADEFAGLTASEATLLDIRSALGARVRRMRASTGITQSELANTMGSSQSRVAKIEAEHPGVSLELVLRALMALGASRSDLGKYIAATASAQTAVPGRSGRARRSPAKRRGNQKMAATRANTFGPVAVRVMGRFG